MAKFRGEMVWHAHEREDELFFVLHGSIEIDLEEQTVLLGAGEMLIVPRGVRHRPRAIEEAHVMLFEPASTAHTGDVQCELTVSEHAHI